MRSGVPIPLTVVGSAVRIPVRVLPRASRMAVGGVRDGRLIVRVTAPPVDGAANEAAVLAVADALGVPTRSVAITSGETSRNKTIDVRGLATQDVAVRLQALCSPPT